MAEGISSLTVLNSIVMVITGSLNAIANKRQGDLGYKYGLTVTFQMFVGEFLNIFALILPIMFSFSYRRRHYAELDKEAEEGQKGRKVGFFRLGFGGFLDSFGSGLQTFAIFLLPASIWQMMRNATVIFVVIFTVVYLKKPVRGHSWVAVVLSMVGFILVGSASLMVESGADPEGRLRDSPVINSLIGIVLLLVSLVFSGFQFAYQEKLFDNFVFDPRRLVGAESIVGAVTLTLCLAITSRIPCPNKEMCTNSIDDPSEGILALLASRELLFWAGCSALSIMVYNLSGLYLTKHVSSIFRIIMDSVRTIVIWAVCISVGLEKFSWPCFYLQAPGFLFLIAGNLVNNRIIKLPCFEPKDQPNDKQEPIVL